MNIGRAVRDLRKQADLSQEQFAPLIGITQPALSKIENNTSKPRQEVLEKMCAVLKVPMALIYVLAIEKEEVPVEKQQVYDILFPIIRDLITVISTPDVIVPQKPLMPELPFGQPQQDQ